MKCSCVEVDVFSEYLPKCRATHEEKNAKKSIRCCECGKRIPIGEIFRCEKTMWESKYKDEGMQEVVFNTCKTCMSIRDNFFCEGWYYERVYDFLRHHIIEMKGEISEDCLASLIPEARAVVCEMIEKFWVADEFYDSM